MKMLQIFKFVRAWYGFEQCAINLKIFVFFFRQVRPSNLKKCTKTIEKEPTTTLTTTKIQGTTLKNSKNIRKIIITTIIITIMSKYLQNPVTIVQKHTSTDHPTNTQIDSKAIQLTTTDTPHKINPTAPKTRNSATLKPDQTNKMKMIKKAVKKLKSQHFRL